MSYYGRRPMVKTSRIYRFRETGKSLAALIWDYIPPAPVGIDKRLPRLLIISRCEKLIQLLMPGIGLRRWCFSFTLSRTTFFNFKSFLFLLFYFIFFSSNVIFFFFSRCGYINVEMCVPCDCAYTFTYLLR